MIKKKFVESTIGLGMPHAEHDDVVAYHWNQCVDEGVSPDTFIKVSDVREHNFKFQNYETGKSLSNQGCVIEREGRWRLSDETIEKCKKFLGIS